MTIEALPTLPAFSPAIAGEPQPWLVIAVYNNGEPAENRYKNVEDATRCFQTMTKSNVILFVALLDTSADDMSLDGQIVATYQNPNLAKPVNRA